MQVDTVPVTVVRYRLGAGSERWRTLQAQLLSEGKKCLKMLSTKPSRGVGALPVGADGFAHYPMNVELRCLFSDQSNATPNEWSETGFRIFDWFLDAGVYDSGTASGHYTLDLAEPGEFNLAVARKTARKCGYCGAIYSDFCEEHHAASSAIDGVFCSSCLGSEYLKESELHLLRLVPVADSFGYDRRSPVEQPLLDSYRQTQAKVAKEYADGQAGRLRKKAEGLRSEHAKNAVSREMELAGFCWLLEHGQDTNNVIFYNHEPNQSGGRGMFCLGWRDPLETMAEVPDVFAEFPWDYRVKVKGRK